MRTALKRKPASQRPHGLTGPRSAWTHWVETGTAINTPPGKRRDEEHEHQVALIAWREALKIRFPEIGLLFAIPNGGLRRPRTAGRLKAEGAQDGVPDLLLPVIRQGCAGLFIEMKSPVGRLSQRQRWWQTTLTETGYRVEVARGWIAACTLIVDYLGLPPALIPPHDTPPKLAAQTSRILSASRQAHQRSHNE